MLVAIRMLVLQRELCNQRKKTYHPQILQKLCDQLWYIFGEFIASNEEFIIILYSDIFTLIIKASTIMWKNHPQKNRKNEKFFIVIHAVPRGNRMQHKITKTVIYCHYKIYFDTSTKEVGLVMKIGDCKRYFALKYIL